MTSAALGFHMLLFIMLPTAPRKGGKFFKVSFGICKQISVVVHSKLSLGRFWFLQFFLY